MSDKKLTINQHREQAYADGLAFGRSLCACHKAEVLAAYKAAVNECKRSETIWRRCGRGKASHEIKRRMRRI